MAAIAQGALVFFTSCAVATSRSAFVNHSLGTTLCPRTKCQRTRSVRRNVPPREHCPTSHDESSGTAWPGQKRKEHRCHHAHNAGLGMSLLPRWGAPPRTEVSVLQLPALTAPDVAVVWFTASDLRTHDHDGLVAVAGAAGVVPLYVFDEQVCCHTRYCCIDSWW